MKGIPLYTEINDLYQLTGAALRTHNPLFHCFDMAETNNLAVIELPPHRADFYTLALNFGTQVPILLNFSGKKRGMLPLLTAKQAGLVSVFKRSDAAVFVKKLLKQSTTSAIATF